MSSLQNQHPIAEFVKLSVSYYEREFTRIQSATGFVWSINYWAALLGPLWAGARGLWGWFALTTLAETSALTILARGLLADPAAPFEARATKLMLVAKERAADAANAALRGDVEAAETFKRLSANLEQAAHALLDKAQHAMQNTHELVITGSVILLLVKIVEGLFANYLYERQYTRWRTNRFIGSGIGFANVLATFGLLTAIIPLTVYRFVVAVVPPVLERVPVSNAGFIAIAARIDSLFDMSYRSANTVFDGIRDGLRGLVAVLDVLLVTTPWPVVMIVIICVAWRLAGRRVAVMAVAAIAYLSLLGLWEQAMQTVALLGTAAIICIGIGIPIGIWLARSARALAVALPILDLMQTLPALVYLIPAIAFFGTGTPPGIIATLIFGMPPVIRLTTLGLQQVPSDIKEAALAYGATPLQLLLGVELPLARRAILAGVNQTILMCLSMVVIAALIGVQGLGSVVLTALQYAASGQGLLAGIAILWCAVVIDRVVQAAFAGERGH
jgi:glycine betaine/proline transport system permease protein